MNGFGVLAGFLMAGTTLPLAFGLARLCLAGVLRVMERQSGR
jgi:hypothetical protein